MFQGKTTIVVGAGASEEVGMPLGSELAARIATAINLRYEHGSRRISGDEEIESALKKYVRETEGHDNINSHRTACMEIVAGMREASSIDEFMHTRSDDKRIQVCGKLGIVHCILRAENSSKLHFTVKNISDTINFEQVQQTWFAQFRKFLAEGCRKEDVAERLEQVTLIVFNYDRCLEHYLLRSLQNYYAIEEKESVDILKHLEIIHPYGVVGKLPWEDININVPYGETGNFGRLTSLADGIRTFTEQAEDSELQDKIRSTMQKSHLILFLGFAFHKQNLDLLTPNNTSMCKAKVIGTAKGISDTDIPVVQSDLADRFSGGEKRAVELRNDLKCYDLTDQYKHKFSNI